MSQEREIPGGINRLQPRESSFRPDRLTLLRAVGSSTPRMLAAAVLLQNPLAKPPEDPGYNSVELAQQFRPLFSEGEEPELRVDAFNRYSRALKRFDFVKITPNTGKSYGKSLDSVRISRNVDQELAKALIGHVLHFFDEHRHLPPERVFSHAEQTDGGMDPILARATLIDALVHAYVPGKEFRITREDLEGITGISRSRISHNLDLLVSEMDLLSRLPAGYRAREGAAEEDIASDASRRIFRTIKDLQAVSREEGGYVKALEIPMYLRATGQIDSNVSRGLRDLLDRGLVDFIPQGSYTIRPEQFATLFAVNEIIQGLASRDDTFVQKGLENFRKNIKNQPLVRSIWQASQESAPGRHQKELISAMGEVLKNIIHEHPGLSRGQLYELLKIRVAQDQRFMMCTYNSMGTMLDSLVAQDDIRAETAGRTFLWFDAHTSKLDEARASAPEILPEIPPSEEVVLPTDKEMGDFYAGIDVTRPFDVFMYTLRTDPSYAVLSRSEQQDRFVRLQEQKASGTIDDALVTDLVNRNLRLVVSVARHFLFSGRRSGMDIMDIIQEGYFVLRDCVLLFDPGKNYTFSTYADRALRSVFSREIPQARGIRIPKGRAEQMSRLRRAGFDPAQNINAEDPAVIARAQEALKVTKKDGTSVLATERVAREAIAVFNMHPESINLTEEGWAVVGRAPDAQERSMRDVLIDSIRVRLPQLYAEIVLNRFGLNEEGRELTKTEIAEQLGISHNRVSSAEKVALQQLREDPELQKLFNS